MAIQQQPKEFEENVIAIDRVSRVVKGGRRFRFRALVVVGDRKHKVAIGIAKGADVTAAVTKATEVAKKRLASMWPVTAVLMKEKIASRGLSGLHLGVIIRISELRGLPVFYHW